MGGHFGGEAMPPPAAPVHPGKPLTYEEEYQQKLAERQAEIANVKHKIPAQEDLYRQERAEEATKVAEEGAIDKQLGGGDYLLSEAEEQRWEDKHEAQEQQEGAIEEQLTALEEKRRLVKELEHLLNSPLDIRRPRKPMASTEEEPEEAAAEALRQRHLHHVEIHPGISRCGSPPPVDLEVYRPESLGIMGLHPAARLYRGPPAGDMEEMGREIPIAHLHPAAAAHLYHSRLSEADSAALPRFGLPAVQLHHRTLSEWDEEEQPPMLAARGPLIEVRPPARARRPLAASVDEADFGQVEGIDSEDVDHGEAESMEPDAGADAETLGAPQEQKAHWSLLLGAPSALQRRWTGPKGMQPTQQAQKRRCARGRDFL